MTTPPVPPVLLPMSWTWLGLVPYGEALERQRLYREEVIEGRAPSTLWLLEHPAVITLGRREDPNPPDLAALERRGISLFQTERGGLATYHGPGQIVGYLIADIGSYGLTVRATVTALEEGLIQWLATRGVMAGRRSDAPGVWAGRDKIAALGLHFKRGVSMHGFAMNLTVDLSPYKLIVPCGITDGGVTSLQVLAPDRTQDPAQAAPSVADHMIRALCARRTESPQDGNA